MKYVLVFTFLYLGANEQGITVTKSENECNGIFFALSRNRSLIQSNFPSCCDLMCAWQPTINIYHIVVCYDCKCVDFNC